LYSAGLTEFARQSYDRAADAFRAFIAQNPRDTRVPDARFYLADSQFAQQRYAEAIPEYEALIRQFPDSRRVPAALVKQAQARLALGDRAGCQLLRDVADGRRFATVDPGRRPGR
jgi:TolA-binding protein